MSCKVLAGTIAVQPFFHTVAPQPECAATQGQSAGTEPDAGPPPEVAELHSRILELERALQGEVRQAREAGYREGEAAGRERAAQELQPVLQKLATSIAGMAALRSQIRRDAEQELVQLSIAIARRILRRELTVDPDALTGLVRSALDKVQMRDICRVRVHPDSVATVEKYLRQSSATAGVDLTGDGSLEPGDVVIETRRGDLDGSIESQLAEIGRGFADRLGR